MTGSGSRPKLPQFSEVGIFSVPPDAKDLEMEVSSGFCATETRRIALGF